MISLLKNTLEFTYLYVCMCIDNKDNKMGSELEAPLENAGLNVPLWAAQEEMVSGMH